MHVSGRGKHIKEIDLGKVFPDTPSARRSLAAVSSLDLSYNTIQTIEKRCLLPLTGLTVLDLSFNEIGLIADLPKSIERLILRSNRLTSKLPSAVTSLPRLGYLDVSENRLETLNNLPRSMPLVVLIADNNQIGSLTADRQEEVSDESTCSSNESDADTLSEGSSSSSSVSSSLCSEAEEEQRQDDDDGTSLRGARGARKRGLRYHSSSGLSRLTSLKMVSLSYNLVSSLDEVCSVFSRLPRLEALSLDGCPVANSIGYRERIINCLSEPHETKESDKITQGLVTLDGTPIIKGRHHSSEAADKIIHCSPSSSSSSSSRSPSNEQPNRVDVSRASLSPRKSSPSAQSTTTTTIKKRGSSVPPGVEVGFRRGEEPTPIHKPIATHPTSLEKINGYNGNALSSAIRPTVPGGVPRTLSVKREEKGPLRVLTPHSANSTSGARNVRVVTSVTAPPVRGSIVSKVVPAFAGGGGSLEGNVGAVGCGSGSAAADLDSERVVAEHKAVIVSLRRELREILQRYQNEREETSMLRNMLKDSDAQLQRSKRLISEQLDTIAMLRAERDSAEEACRKVNLRLMRQEAELKYATAHSEKRSEQLREEEKERTRVRALLEAQYGLGGGGGGATTTSSVSIMGLNKTYTRSGLASLPSSRRAMHVSNLEDDHTHQREKRTKRSFSSTIGALRGKDTRDVGPAPMKPQHKEGPPHFARSSRGVGPAPPHPSIHHDPSTVFEDEDGHDATYSLSNDSRDMQDVREESNDSERGRTKTKALRAGTGERIHSFSSSSSSFSSRGSECEDEADLSERGASRGVPNSKDRETTSDDIGLRPEEKDGDTSDYSGGSKKNMNSSNSLAAQLKSWMLSEIHNSSLNSIANTSGVPLLLAGEMSLVDTYHKSVDTSECIRTHDVKSL